jgi:hypothetical protein
VNNRYPETKKAATAGSLRSFLTKRGPAVFLVAVIALQIIVRVSLFPNHNLMLDDQCANLLSAEEALKTNTLPAWGPAQMHTGGISLGPVYYYFHITASWLLRGNPQSGSILVQAFFILSILALFYGARKLVSLRFAYIVTLLYACCESIFFFTLFGWNLNISFFFIIASFYFLFSWVKEPKLRYLIWFGIVGGILSQLHLTLMILVLASYLVCLIFHWRAWLKQIWTVVLVLPLWIYLLFLTGKTAGR